MPVYEYKCSECNQEFEAKKSYSEDISATCCPKCGKDAKKLFTPVPIIFKGSGFYVTDCRGGNSALGESKNEAKAETKLEAKAETKAKTKTKTETKPTEAKAATPA
jgi:putative FmdB family regulatory protein